MKRIKLSVPPPNVDVCPRCEGKGYIPFRLMCVHTHRYCPKCDGTGFVTIKVTQP